tara:strand:+ start:139 stop:2028 length:1890 start_codon:yes stop_codon:yes gene_type:complete
MAKPGKNKISVREIYKYLMTFPGMTNNKAVGILGNIKAESSFYADAVEMGDVKNKGLGLFQYTFPERKEAYKKQVPDWKTNWKGQIDFAMQEEEMKKYLAKNYDDPAEATESFMLTFEKPKDQSEEAIEERVSGIRNIYLGSAKGKRNTIVKQVEDAQKTYSATRKPADLSKLNTLKNKLKAFDEGEENRLEADLVKQNKNKLNNLLATETNLREELKTIQNNPLDYTQKQIDDVQKKIDLAAINISEIQNSEFDKETNSYKIGSGVRPTGPFGYSKSQIGDMDFSSVLEPPKEEVVKAEGDTGETPFMIPEIDIVEKRIKKNVESDAGVDEGGDAKDGEQIDFNFEQGQGSKKMPRMTGDKVFNLLGGVSTLAAALFAKKALGETMKDIDLPAMPELSEAFKRHFYESEQLAKTGLTVAEERLARKSIDAAYDQGVDNLVRGTSGDRARFLAGSGLLDARRASALLQVAAMDDDAKRKNRENFTRLLDFKENYEKNISLQERNEKIQGQLAKKESYAKLGNAALQQVVSGLESIAANKQWNDYMKFQYHNMGYDMDETYTPSIFERAKNITKGIGQGFQKAFATKEGGTDVGNFFRSFKPASTNTSTPTINNQDDIIGFGDFEQQDMV